MNVVVSTASLRRVLAIACATLGALAGCGGGGSSGGADGGGSGGGGGGTTAPPIASVALAPSHATLEPGWTAQIAAEARSAAGAVVTGTTFTWSTADGAVATVAGGVVTAVAPGTTTLRAQAGGVQSEPLTITVRDPAATGATSSALIDSALAAGQITSEQALAYKVYAAFNDPALPASYRGSDSAGMEASALSEVVERFDTLTEATQNALGPYLRRPSDSGSWVDSARRAAGTARPHALAARPLSRPSCLGTLGGWAAVDPPTAKVRVWYDTANATHRIMADKVADTMDRFVWPRLIGSLAFKEPIDDSTIVGCHGGNGKLDFYIVSAATMSNRGETIESFASRYQGDTHIRIRDNQSDEQLKQTVAHEFMHAVNWAYRTAAPQTSYGWFRDALANWAADEVFAGNEPLNRQASCQLRSAQLALEDESIGHCDGASGLSRNYGSYLVLRFIGQTDGPLMVRSIVEATQRFSTGLEAIDRTVSGGLKTVWPQYAKRLWNQEPIPALYPNAHFDYWDAMGNAATKTPRAPALFTGNGNLAGAPTAETPLDSDLNNVSVRFYRFTFTEERTRSLMFHNTFFDSWKAGKAVAVQALLKSEISGDWIEEDWTEYEWIGLCRDAKEQRISEVIIVISSAEYRGASPQVSAARAPRMMRNNVGCWAYAGTTSRTFINGAWSSGVMTTTTTAKFDYRPGGRPNWMIDRANGLLRVPISAPQFLQIDWRLFERYSETNCSYDLDRSGADLSNVLGGQAAGNLIINNFLESLPLAVRNPQVQLVGNQPGAYEITGVSTRRATGSVSGPQPECGTSYESAVGAWLLTTKGNGPLRQVASDGHLRGTFDTQEPGDNFTERFVWDLAPQREP